MISELGTCHGDLFIDALGKHSVVPCGRELLLITSLPIETLNSNKNPGVKMVRNVSSRLT